MCLTLWCHLVDSRFGDRDNYIKQLDDPVNDGQAVRILCAARNAFVHCGWDITKMDKKNQEVALRKFVSAGGGHTKAKVFKVWIEGGNILRMTGVGNLCHTLNKEAAKNQPTK